MAQEVNAVVVYVLDAIGDKYCYSASRLQYETAAIKHARWWTRQRASRMRAVAPFKVVAERYFDASQKSELPG